MITILTYILMILLFVGSLGKIINDIRKAILFRKYADEIAIDPNVPKDIRDKAQRILNERDYRAQSYQTASEQIRFDKTYYKNRKRLKNDS